VVRRSGGCHPPPYDLRQSLSCDAWRHDCADTRCTRTSPLGRAALAAPGSCRRWPHAIVEDRGPERWLRETGTDQALRGPDCLVGSLCPTFTQMHEGLVRHERLRPRHKNRTYREAHPHPQLNSRNDRAAPPPASLINGTRRVQRDRVRYPSGGPCGPCSSRPGVDPAGLVIRALGLPTVPLAVFVTPAALVIVPLDESNLRSPRRRRRCWVVRTAPNEDSHLEPQRFVRVRSVLLL